MQAEQQEKQILKIAFLVFTELKYSGTCYCRFIQSKHFQNMWSFRC